MFLTVKSNTILDFLTALGFIAPKGFSPDYFLTPSEGVAPATTQALQDNGFVEEPLPAETHSEANVTYIKRDPKLSHSFSYRKNNVTDSNVLPPPMPKQPDQPAAPVLSQNVEIKNPYRAIQIAENKGINEVAYILKESFAGLPKNTLISFKEDISDEDLGTTEETNTVSYFCDDMGLSEDETQWIADFLEHKEHIEYKDDLYEECQQEVSREDFIEALDALKASPEYGKGYEEPEDDSCFSVRVRDRYGREATIKVCKDGSHWIEKCTDKDDDFDFTPKSYMGYLTKKDIKQWLSGDFESVEEC